MPRVMPIRVFLTACLTCAVAVSAAAAPPWQTMFKKVEADANKAYELTEQQGPWLIMCTSFAGETADQQAHDLVLELRSKFKLNAYVHRQHYDFTGKESGLGLNRFGEPKRMKYVQETKFDELAVLVGDFPSIDDPKMQKTLEQIRSSQPDCLKAAPAKPAPPLGKTPTSGGPLDLREWRKSFSLSQGEKVAGPLVKAFVTRNPLLPEEFFVPKGLDPSVKEWNKDVEYSLLKCPGKYSVQIARFRGAVTIDPRKVKEIESGGVGVTNRLEEAAMKAHNLTLALRKKGVEAYEFHDREESIVTIGSFNDVGTPRADGKEEINPAVHKIMLDYGPQKVNLPGQVSVGLQPKVVDGIPCDVQPLPVKVPRDSIASNYARTGSFR